MKRLYAVIIYIIGGTVLWQLAMHSNINMWFLLMLITAFTVVSAYFIFPSIFKFEKKPEPEPEPNWILRIIVIYVIVLVVMFFFDLHLTEWGQYIIIPAGVAYALFKLILESF